MRANRGPDFNEVLYSAQGFVVGPGAWVELSFKKLPLGNAMRGQQRHSHRSKTAQSKECPLHNIFYFAAAGPPNVSRANHGHRQRHIRRFVPLMLWPARGFCYQINFQGQTELSRGWRPPKGIQGPPQPVLLRFRFRNLKTNRAAFRQKKGQGAARAPKKVGVGDLRCWKNSPGTSRWKAFRKSFLDREGSCTTEKYPRVLRVLRPRRAIAGRGMGRAEFAANTTWAAWGECWGLLATIRARDNEACALSQGPTRVGGS